MRIWNGMMKMIKLIGGERPFEQEYELKFIISKTIHNYLDQIYTNNPYEENLKKLDLSSLIEMILSIDFLSTGQ